MIRLSAWESQLQAIIRGKNMTIPSGEVGVTYHTGNGVADTFDYEFKITAASDLKVTQTDTNGVDTVLTLTTDYTVSGVGANGGGSITLTSALTDQYTLTIEDNVETSQLTPFGNQSSFNASLHEDAYDKNTRIARKASELAGRSLVLPSSVQGVSTELPKPVALRLLRWNSDANAFELVSNNDLITATAFSNFKVDTFSTGADFTPGVSTQLTLTEDPGAENNTQIYFDGVYQTKDTYSVSTTTVTFSSPIPGGTNKVEIVYGTALVQGATTDADLVDYDNSTSGLTATDTQSAIDEVDAAVAKKTEANAFTKTQTWAKGSDVASAAALALGDGNYYDITGTTSITSIVSKGVGTVVKLHFDDALTLTHHVTDLILPGSSNIVTAAGDEAEFIEYAAGDWRCTNYIKSGIKPAQAVITQNGKIATHKNLVITRTSATVLNITADELLLEDSLRNIYKAFGVNENITITTIGISGLDATDTEGANTWYYLFILYNGTDVNGFMSDSASPTLPSDYTYSAYVGAAYNDGASDFVNFRQTNKEAVLDVPLQDYATTAIGASAQTPALTVPPNALAKILVNINDTVASRLLVTEVPQTDSIPSPSLFHLRITANTHGNAEFTRRVDSSSQIRLRSDVTTTDVQVFTDGWIFE